jgi:hypothetical protein
MSLFYRKILFLILLINLSSCVGLYQSGVFTDLRDNKNEVNKLTEENCSKSEVEVTLFFEGEPINFEYERIGLVEVKGNQSSNDKDVLEELKVLSKGKCCDAVIGIKKSQVTREAGIIFITDSKDSYKYNAITYSGIAIKRKNKQS